MQKIILTLILILALASAAVYASVYEKASKGCAEGKPQACEILHDTFGK